MKRMITLTGLCMAATLLASPAFAADDLCAANLQKIDDQDKTAGTASAQLFETNKEDLQKAHDAQTSGDKKTCIALSTRILQDFEKTNSTEGGAK